MFFLAMLQKTDSVSTTAFSINLSNLELATLLQVLHYCNTTLHLLVATTNYFAVNSINVKKKNLTSHPVVTKLLCLSIREAGG